jgi:4'-phosphopantetheinyl transferase
VTALTLPAGEVHIWQMRLDPGPDQLERLHSLLSPEERARAARYRFREHARRFIAGRGRLRELLAAYLGCEPAGIRFRYGASGKPAVAAGTDLRFNVSHSEEVALYVFARGREVGIDIERIRPDFRWERIARRYYSAAEQELLRTLPPELRAAAFFQFWTRKEAYLKARGEGLRFGRLHAEADGDAAWWVVTLEAPPGFAAALVVESREPLPVLRRMTQLR